MTQIAGMKSAPSSRIPMPVPRKKGPLEYDLNKAPSAPTKLELMQMQYQEKLRKDKDKRMYEINLQNEERTMRFGDNQNRSIVKDFFKERREMANYGDHVPNIEQHFQKKKTGGKTESLSYTNHHQHKKQYGYGKPPHKNSAGRDKANPLAPIERPPRGPDVGKRSRKSSAASNGSFYSQNQAAFPRKPAPLVRPPMSRKTSFGSGANTPIGDDFNGRRSKAAGDMSEDEDRNAIFSSRNTSPKSKKTSFKEWQEKQKKIREKQHVNSTTQDTEFSDGKMTDFQKWQMEQDRDRTQRLQKHAQVNGIQQTPISYTNRSGASSKAEVPYRAPDGGVKSPGRAKKELLQKHINTQSKKHLYASQNSSMPVSDEESDVEANPNESQEIVKKQKELELLLRRQQEELEKMKKQREREEEQERKAREREAKRAEQQRIRRQKLQEAEEKKRREQEEKDRKESEKREKDEQDMTWYQDQYNQQPQNSSRQNQNSYRGHKDVSHYEAPASRTESQARNTPAFIPKKAARVKANRNKQPPPRQLSPQQDPEPYVPPQDTAAIYEAASELPDSHGKVDLAPCRICGRKFAKERLPKHMNACKTSQKKRKVFDGSKMRVEGTEQAQFVNEKKRRPSPKPKKNNWRTHHENFIQSIRYAKKVTEIEQTGGDVSQLAPPPKTENPDYVPCPHCNRTFNATAAERHIPRCKDIKTRPAPMKHNNRRR